MGGLRAAAADHTTAIQYTVYTWICCCHYYINVAAQMSALALFNNRILLDFISNPMHLLAYGCACADNPTCARSFRM